MNWPVTRVPLCDLIRTKMFTLSRTKRKLHLVCCTLFSVVLCRCLPRVSTCASHQAVSSHNLSLHECSSRSGWRLSGPIACLRGVYLIAETFNTESEIRLFASPFCLSLRMFWRLREVRTCSQVFFEVGGNVSLAKRLT